MPPAPIPNNLRRRGRDPAAAEAHDTLSVFSLRADRLWAYFKQQDLGFWAMCFYLVVEYMRPQQSMELLKGMPLGQICLGAALVGALMSGSSSAGSRSVASILMLTFTAIIIASSMQAYSPDASFAKIRTWFSWVCVYFFIITIVNTKQRFAFYTLVWLMCHYYMSQGGFKQFAGRGFTFASWGIIGAPGWFQNSGEFAIAMCMMFAVSWHYYMATKQYLTKWRRFFVLGMPVTAAVDVIGSSSRGAVAGLAAIGLCVLIRNKVNLKGILSIALVAGAAWFILPDEQKARFSAAGEDKTSINRKVYWLNGLQIAATHPMLGIGYENWLEFYDKFYKDSEISAQFKVYTVQVVHNIFIQCAAELGYLGLGCFVLLILATIFINNQTRRIVKAGRDPPDMFVMHMSWGLDEAMWSYLVAGFFVTVLYYPFFWINLALSVALNTTARLSVRAAPRVRGAPAAARPRTVFQPAASSRAS